MRPSRFPLLVAAAAATCAAAAAAQETELERRVRALEAEVGEKAALETRVKDLEARLGAYESGEAATEIAVAREINALAARAAGAVEAPKSRTILLGGQLRTRFESRDPFDYRTPGTFGRPGTDVFGTDDDRFEQRTRLFVDARPTEFVRVYLQLQDTRVWGFETSVLSNEKNVDLHQGFVDVEKIFGEALSLRLGRQELSFGDQRMVSPLDWSSIARSWDGLRLMWRPENWQVDVFWTQIKDSAARTPTPGPTGDDDTFGGLYASYRGHAEHEYDVYLMNRRTHDGTVASEAGPTGDADDWWIGLRAKGQEGDFDWTAEGVYLFGDRAGDDVGAFGTAATVGYTFKDAASLRLGLEWTFATGDENGTDGDVDRFEAPFPFGHNYQGWADVFGWKNGHDFAFHASVKPDADVTLGGAFHYFLLDEERDAWFNAALNPLRRDATGAAGDNVGSEVDLYVKWTVRPQLLLFAGYSRFFAGSFVENTGPAPDQDWIFLMLTADF